MSSENFSTLCHECGARLVDPEAACWLCGVKPISAELRQPGMQNPYAAPQASVDIPLGGAGLLLRPLVIISLVLVAAGLFLVAPGLGLFGTFMLIPVLVRTYMVVERRQQAGKTVTWWQKVVLFLTSFVVAYVIMTVVIFAAFGAFCAACLAGASTQNSEATIIMAFVAAAVAGLFVAIGMGYWVKSRYRRDIQRP